jgi:hypothetical protein
MHQGTRTGLKYVVVRKKAKIKKCCPKEVLSEKRQEGS